MSTPQFIFTMHRVDKFHGPEKHVLKDITLLDLEGNKRSIPESDPDLSAKG